MKKAIMYDVNGEKVQKEINYIPVRYILPYCRCAFIHKYEAGILPSW